MREGDATKEIVLLADQLPADLLVLGTHGRSGFERLFLGSVTEKVLRTTRTPVMTIPPPVTQPGPALYKTILCPLDFSERIDASARLRVVPGAGSGRAPDSVARDRKPARGGGRL